MLIRWGGSIRARRLELGLTVDAIAAAVEVDRSNVVRWEAGKTEPNLTHRVALSSALDIPAKDLFDY